MLGYIAPNKDFFDVYSFFENDEVERLATERIKGKFVNLAKPQIIGTLEAFVDPRVSDRIKIPTIKNAASDPLG